MDDFKKANELFKDRFDIQAHAVIVFTQLLFPVSRLVNSIKENYFFPFSFFLSFFLSIYYLYFIY
jgi:hypothetical protein